MMSHGTTRFGGALRAVDTNRPPPPPGQSTTAATKIAAVARGRTGRRRSIEEARDRFGFLKAQSSRVPLHQPRSASVKPATNRATAGSTAASRSRSRMRAPSAPAPPPPPNEAPMDTAALVATQICSVLERVGVESVIPELMKGTVTMTTEEIAKATTRVAERGTRWDLNQKIKVREERIKELRGCLTKMGEQQRAFGSLAEEVELKLLKEISVARELAAAAERGAIDGSGLRDKLERLERERDEARDKAAILEVSLTRLQAVHGEVEKSAAAQSKETTDARREAELVRSELLTAAVANSRLAAVESTEVRFSQQHIERLERELKEAQMDAGLLRGELASAQLRLSSTTTTESCLVAAADARRDDAIRRADELAEIASAERARASKLEGAIEASERHEAATKQELLAARKEAALLEAGFHVSRDSESARSREAEEAVATVRRRCESLEAELAKAEEHGSKLKEEADAKIEEAVSGLKKAEAELLESSRDLERLETEASSLREATEAAHLDLEAAQQKAALEMAKLGELSSKSAADEARVVELRDRAERAEKAVDDKTEALQACERRLLEAESRLSRSESDRDSHVEARSELQKRATELAEEAAKASGALHVERELKKTAEAKEAAERRERTAALAQLLALQDRNSREAEERRERGLSDEESRKLAEAEKQATIATLEAARDAQSERNAQLAAELETLEKQLQSEELLREKHATLELGKANGELEKLKRRLSTTERQVEKADLASQNRVLQLEDLLREADSTRRKLHNTIQELRGNVRVFARVRPFLPSDNGEEEGSYTDDSSPIVTNGAENTSLVLRAEAELSTAEDEGLFAGKHKREAQSFCYDRVFGPASGQEEVFNEVSEFVQSALDGYQVCLFSYGQTGSGKTHTMQGSGVGPMSGIIPRSMRHVARYLDEQRDRGWVYDLHVTYVEIYNETVRDLLSETSSDTASSDSLEVRRDPKTGRVHVENATTRALDPADSSAVEELTSLAARHRCTAATEMNAQSSRSHAVFTLHLLGTNAIKRARVRGALNLVDLAGSERLARSGATGQRAKEAAHINKSLSALAGVFAALHAKRPHVPYRDSKLTFLLQPALSADGKTLLFVNLSPTPQSASESLCSLRFAQQVNSVELGKATRHIEAYVDDENIDGGGAPQSSSKMKKPDTEKKGAKPLKTSTNNSSNRAASHRSPTRKQNHP